MDLSALKFDSDGLIPAIVQDFANGEVLMMAFMNAEAVNKTVETGRTHFYSRSRQKLWMKGESSGHVQTVREVLYDCDADCLLVKVDQEVAACHTGHRSCFYRDLATGQVKAEVVLDEGEVYVGREKREVLYRLAGVIADRKKNPRPDSYTNRLLSSGAEGIGKKIMEEGLELTLAAQGTERSKVANEAADLLYHAWVMLGLAGVSTDEVFGELARRFGVGGLKEKAGRGK